MSNEEVLLRINEIRSLRMNLLYKEDSGDWREIGNPLFHLLRDDLPWLCDQIAGSEHPEIDAALKRLKL